MVKPHKLEENPKAVWAFDAISENSIYVDLLTDREAFTGYQGGAIWKQIYDDNCWNSFEKCNDNKFLYRMISGMHSSVSSHLSEYYIYEETMKMDANVRVYYEKVGVHPDRIKNLLLAVNLMWRALNRFADRINDFEIDTGDLMADVSAKQYLMLLTRVLEPVKDFYFDDSQIFGRVKDHDEQKRLFNKFFTDIIKLMDCVDCVKCKVYGKMQVLGLGTALRILLNDDLKELTRNELVAFVNSLAKWTESVVINRRMRERSYNSHANLKVVLMFV